MNKNEIILILHGIYMNRIIMMPLANRLMHLGYQVYLIAYSSLFNTVHQNSEVLIQEIEKKMHQIMQENSSSRVSVHCVGHSLGGLIIREAYLKRPDLFTGKIVTLGTPHQRPQIVEKMKPFRFLLGKAYKQCLDGDLPIWKGDVPLGSIAGNLALGPGCLFGIDKPSDGTVRLEETYLENSSDHIVLPVNHIGLVYSKNVVVQINAFLQSNKFLH